MPHRKYQSVRHITLPALFCALAGVALSVGLSIMGFYQEAENWLQAMLEAKPFYLRNGYMWGREVEWLLTGALSFGLAMAVLDSPGKWRRCALGLMVVVLMLTLVPVLALWGVLWLPIFALVAVLWTLLSAFIYSSHHIMPCEATLVTVPGRDKPAKIEIHHETVPLPVRKKAMAKPEDMVEEKYRPKPIDSAVNATDDHGHGKG